MSEMNFERFDLIEDKVWQPSWYQKLAIKILSTGDLPKHVSVIMDGNRRWASERGRAPIFGHFEGIKTADQLFHWVNEFGIPELTVYAFSPENFKRDKNEVNQLMEMSSVYLQRAINKNDSINEKGFRFMIYGDIDNLPSKIKSLSAKLMLQTRFNKKFQINIAFNYKSTDEIDMVVETLIKAVQDGDLLVTDIDEQLFDKCLYSGQVFNRGGKCPDLLIRTSGEIRFSDFYLWQLIRKPLFFTAVKWPDFSFFTLCKALFMFQRYFSKTNEVQKEYDYKMKGKDKLMSDADKQARDERVKRFIDKREELFYKHLTEIVNKNII